MKSTLLVISLLLACVPFMLAQPVMQSLYFQKGCSFNDEENGGMMDAFEPHEKAKAIVAEILDVMNVEDRNFVLQASGDVSNAFATYDAGTGTPYILYNVTFLQNFQEQSLTQWAAYFVLAHEVAHHVLGHTLTQVDAAAAKQNELKADAWAARFLARKGVTFDDALSGVRTFDLDGESSTHPAPSAREQAIGVAWMNERDRRPEPGPDEGNDGNGGSSGSSGITFTRPIDLDYTRKNRWNLFSPIFLKNAFIDDEKITIRYDVPAAFRYRPLTICLSANNDAGIIPGATLPDTAVLRGVGANVFFDPNHNIIVWNYRRENLTPEVAQRAKLQLFVYDFYAPNPPRTMGWVGSSLVVAAGIGSSIYGISEINEAWSVHQTYENVLNPMDPVYDEESRSDRYDRANGHYHKGQWFLGGGIVAIAAGGLWLYDKFRQQRTYERDVCTAKEGLAVTPMLHFSAGGLAVGARVDF